MKLFSQTSPIWKYEKIGKSNLTLGGYGCTTSCIADASSYFEEEQNPYNISKMDLYTKDGLVLWKNIGKCFKKFEFEYRYYDYFPKIINAALADPDKVVLLNVSNKKHWVFLMGRSIPLFGYRVSDPYPFPAKVTRRKDIAGFTVLRHKK
jgi:hypothetical protein